MLVFTTWAKICINNVLQYTLLLIEGKQCNPTLSIFITKLEKFFIAMSTGNETSIHIISLTIAFLNMRKVYLTEQDKLLILYNIYVQYFVVH